MQALVIRTVMVVGLVLAFTTKSNAQSRDCKFEDWLSRTLTQTEDMIDEFARSGRTTRTRELRLTLAEFGRPALTSAMTKDGYGGYGPVVDLHIATARSVMAGRQAHDTDGFELHAHRLRLQGTTSQLRAAISRINCAADAEETATRGGTNTAQSAVPAIEFIYFRTSVNWHLMLGLALLMAALAALLVFESRRKARKRRVQRFICNIACTVEVGGETQASSIVDISEFGAKLRLNLKNADDAPLQVTTTFFAVSARLIWANAHYCGVVFDQSLSQGVLQEALGIPILPEPKALPQ